MLVTLASAPGFGLYKYVLGLDTYGLDLGVMVVILVLELVIWSWAWS